MRGTSYYIVKSKQEMGIIPAHAGHMVTIVAGIVTCGDHPRPCGAHGVHIAKDRGKPGSSPPMRGTYFFPFHDKDHDGIIPAHAGHIPVQ